MSVAVLVRELEGRETARRAARDRAAEAVQRSADPAVYQGERFWFPGDPCPAGHETDAFGNCLGSCAGEEWDR